MIQSEADSWKQALIQDFSLLVRLSSTHGLFTLSQELQQAYLPKLKAEQLSVVVLGEFNHGKSTFINALLGAEVMPTGVIPTTATINHLVYTEAPQAKIRLRNGEMLTLSLESPDEMDRFITLKGDKHEQVVSVEIGWPAPLLKNGITLVDTPGVNDINESRAEITYQYIPRADLVLFLLDASQVLKQSELTFLQQRLLKQTKERIIFVLGKVDLLTAKELEEVSSYCRQKLSSVIQNPVIFPLSARMALKGSRESLAQSGMAAFLTHVQQRLEQEKLQILRQNGRSEVTRMATYLRQSLVMKHDTIRLDVEHLKEKAEHLQHDVRQKQTSLQQIQQHSYEHTRALAARVEQEMQQFVHDFGLVLPGQIDNASVSDLQAYLHGFLQDTVASWVEQQAMSVGKELELITERAMKLTSAYVDETMQSMSMQWPELRLPTAKTLVPYEAGAWAISTVGASMMLFANTLLGGAIAISAPLVALVLNTRAAGQLKQRLQVQAAEALREASVSVVLHFQEAIDAFAQQLNEFVLTAGTGLLQNMSEMLNQAIKERQLQQEPAQERLLALETHLQQLSELIERNKK